MKDHPRRCGENMLQQLKSNPAAGSPPQVRGKRTDPSDYNSLLMDHPRRCGENDTIAQLRQELAGSPPQVRGKRRDSDSVHRATRITPAGAGKTVRGVRSGGAYADHPRRCGENSSKSNFTL